MKQFWLGLGIGLALVTALAFAQCTSTSTAAQLSRREKGCVQMSMANYVAARAHIGQVLSQRAQDAGKDM